LWITYSIISCSRTMHCTKLDKLFYLIKLYLVQFSLCARLPWLYPHHCSPSQLDRNHISVNFNICINLPGWSYQATARLRQRSLWLGGRDEMTGSSNQGCGLVTDYFPRIANLCRKVRTLLICFVIFIRLTWGIIIRYKQVGDRLCGLVVSVENYKHRGPGFDSQDFSEGVGSGTGSTQPRDRINWVVTWIKK
jgi:hypothetical protein